MSPSIDRPALVVGVVFLVLAVSGLLDNSGLLRHPTWWAGAVVVVGLAAAVAAQTVRSLLRR